MYKFAFFDARPYDKHGFDLYGRKNCIVFKYLETKLNIDTVELAHGYDGICVFVNDDLNAQVTTQNISDFFEGKELKNEICYHCDKKPQCQKKRAGRCF